MSSTLVEVTIDVNNNNSFDSFFDIYEWCSENCEGKFYPNLNMRGIKETYKFELGSDAAMFIMKFQK